MKHGSHLGVREGKLRQDSGQVVGGWVRLLTAERLQDVGRGSRPDPLQLVECCPERTDSEARERLRVEQEAPDLPVLQTSFEGNEPVSFPLTAVEVANRPGRCGLEAGDSRQPGLLDLRAKETLLALSYGERPRLLPAGELGSGHLVLSALETLADQGQIELPGRKVAEPLLRVGELLQETEEDSEALLDCPLALEELGLLEESRAEPRRDVSGKVRIFLSPELDHAVEARDCLCHLIRISSQERRQPQASLCLHGKGHVDLRHHLERDDGFVVVSRCKVAVDFLQKSPFDLRVGGLLPGDRRLA